MHAAIVTGVSRGLGEALAAALLARSAYVLGVGRRSSAKLAGPRYRFVECDLARPAAIAAAVLPALRELAGLQLSAVTLVNNAAVATPLGLAGQLDIAAADEAFATNVTAPLALTDLFLRSFDASLERRVLNISSGAAQTAIAGSAVYCMSKAALEMLTKAIAADHGGPHFRCIALRPGIFETGMQALLRAQDPETFPSAALFRGFKDSGALKDPGAVAVRIVERLIAGPVEHGRVYDHTEL
ncbi:MAG: SDR family NAD(P)-dependent oxidoreductase [Betaproteobacteria bacterium]|nr:SDR family NAD(P)-dependent oxidoreductase [Betaproteobacteria bacterium]